MKMNAFIKDFGKHRAPGKKMLKGSIYSKQLGGMGIECGTGTVGTNTSFQVQMSKRGVKEAFSPSGPSGK